MKIGLRQQSILSAIYKNGGKFWPSCGIVWLNFSTTRAILDSLVKKRLLTDKGNCRYTITEKGKELGDPDRYFKELLNKQLKSRKRSS